jgi:hypothetical protein
VAGGRRAIHGKRGRAQRRWQPGEGEAGGRGETGEGRRLCAAGGGCEPVRHRDPDPWSWRRRPSRAGGLVG